MQRSSSAPCPHPLRPQAYRSFEHPLWEYLFSQSDAEAMSAPAEIRHPFVDLRLLRYMLAVPAIPWARDKYLLRRAMRRSIARPSAAAAKVPVERRSAMGGRAPAWLARHCSPKLGLEKYVDPTRVPDQANHDMMTFWADLRPRTLNYWLRNLRTKAERILRTRRTGKGYRRHTEREWNGQQH